MAEISNASADRPPSSATGYVLVGGLVGAGVLSIALGAAALRWRRRNQGV